MVFLLGLECATNNNITKPKDGTCSISGRDAVPEHLLYIGTIKLTGVKYSCGFLWPFGTGDPHFGRRDPWVFQPLHAAELRSSSSTSSSSTTSSSTSSSSTSTSSSTTTTVDLMAPWLGRQHQRGGEGAIHFMSSNFCSGGLANSLEQRQHPFGAQPHRHRFRLR